MQQNRHYVSDNVVASRKVSLIFLRFSYI